MILLLIEFLLYRSQPNKGPWIVRLSSPTYKAFLEYCPEPGIRWNAWNAYNTRASGYADKSTNNSIHIEEIRSKRYGSSWIY